MDEYLYNYNLLKVQNNQLQTQIKALEDVIHSSRNAFLFYYINDDKFSFDGDWASYFPGLDMRSWRDTSKLIDLVDYDKRDNFINLLQTNEYKGNFASYLITLKDGNRSMECEFKNLYDDNGKPWCKCIKFMDVTALNDKKRELEKLAYYDQLTGLYNRNSFILHISNWIELAGKENTTVSLAGININDFRQINDGIGLMVGDELLTSFGRYLSSLMDDSEHYICAHINADIFFIAIYDPMGERTIDKLCGRIRKDLKEKPFDLSGEQVYVTVRMGVAEFPEAGSTALELFERAEIVMFKSGIGDDNWIRHFNSAAINDFVQSAKVEQKLKNADFDKELVLYFQPQYSARTGNIRGAEALIRWKDKNGKLIPPGLFIPVAERSNIIVDIGEWVVERALTKLEEWQSRYGTSITIAVNISARHFAKKGFVDFILKALERHGVAPKCLELEITETVVVENFEKITEKLRELMSHGIQTALDDFGTGYSSFSYLRSLPLNIIKIDKSFIDSMLEDDKGNILVGCIVDMMNRLGYETVAEGVEEHRQYDVLKEMGCTYIQGYLLSKPLPESDFESLLDDQIWE